MKRSDGIKFLEKDGPGLACFSHYGRTTRDCAPVARRLAYLLARESGSKVDYDSLDYAMGLVVNDHDDVAYIIRNYGYRKYS